MREKASITRTPAPAGWRPAGGSCWCRDRARHRQIPAGRRAPSALPGRQSPPVGGPPAPRLSPRPGCRVHVSNLPDRRAARHGRVAGTQPRVSNHCVGAHNYQLCPKRKEVLKTGGCNPACTVNRELRCCCQNSKLGYGEYAWHWKRLVSRGVAPCEFGESIGQGSASKSRHWLSMPPRSTPNSPPRPNPNSSPT
jgi:hypothetical protein